jgi:hypothetical protein
MWFEGDVHSIVEVKQERRFSLPQYEDASRESTRGRPVCFGTFNGSIRGARGIGFARNVYALH